MPPHIFLFCFDSNPPKRKKLCAQIQAQWWYLAVNNKEIMVATGLNMEWDNSNLPCNSKDTECNNNKDMGNNPLRCNNTDNNSLLCNSMDNNLLRNRGTDNNRNTGNSLLCNSTDSNRNMDNNLEECKLAYNAGRNRLVAVSLEGFESKNFLFLF